MDEALDLMALDVTVTCDLWVLTGEDCSASFSYAGAIPEAAIYGPFLRSGWVPFLDGWSFRQDEHYGWLTLCSKHADTEKKEKKNEDG